MAWARALGSRGIRRRLIGTAGTYHAAVLWTVLLLVYFAGALLFVLGGFYMIAVGKSGFDLIVVGLVWPVIPLCALADRLRRKPPGSN